MKKKLIVVFVFMLLITTAMSAVGNLNENVFSNINPEKSFQPLGGGLDQEQTKQDGMGFNIVPEQWLA